MKIYNGLTDTEVIESRIKNGSNTITGKKKNTFFELLIQSFGDPIIKILIIALAIKLVFLLKDFDWFETVGIVIAIFIASLISTVSEYGSEKAFNNLQKEASKLKCRVKRNGKIDEVFIDNVVVNDLVLLQAGDKVPADGILVEGDLVVDESSLNGETKEVKKTPISSIKNIEEKNIIFRGTVIYSNEGIIKVTKVGNQTFYGKLAQELKETSPQSPLKLRLTKLAKTISRIGYIGAFLVSFSYLFSMIVIKNNFQIGLITKTLTNIPLVISYILYALTLSVTIIVVAVPEGLPMMITLVLSSNMKKMLKKQVMVRKMVGIETAGSLNILFTDKTGTLTKGKMLMTSFMDGDLLKYNNESELKKNNNFDIITKSIIYNNASIYSNGKIMGGNLTDRAILSFIKPKQYGDKRLEFSPFNSNNKYSKAVIKDKVKTMLIKGAPEKLLPLCKNYLNNKQEVKPINKNRINAKLKEENRMGSRIICFAISDKDEMKNLTLLGFAIIKDEVRKEAITGLKLIKRAHIQIIMITGDNKDTAMAIGKEVGIITNKHDLVITSDELRLKSDDEVKMILPHLKIVARSLPQDKSRLVRIAQELNLVVGMTGDGVNDAPALKKADVGFSMGSGTEVAKEASDIIILNDNLYSISQAILFGRTIFKSIRKFIIFQLTVNICAVGLSIIGPFIGVETPVTIIQMLWINMVMDTFAGLAFSYEPPLEEYMDEVPKKRNEPIINRYMKDQIIITGLYSCILCIIFLKIPFIKSLYRLGQNNQYLLSAFFSLFMFIGIFNCFNARTHRLNLFAHILKNKVFIFVILFIIIIQILLIYYGGSLFRTVGLTFKELQTTILIAISVIPADWIRKLYLRSVGNKGGA